MGLLGAFLIGAVIKTGFKVLMAVGENEDLKEIEEDENELVKTYKK